jgi:hypothetical protein
VPNDKSNESSNNSAIKNPYSPRDGSSTADSKYTSNPKKNVMYPVIAPSTNNRAQSSTPTAQTNNVNKTVKEFTYENIQSAPNNTSLYSDNGARNITTSISGNMITCHTTYDTVNNVSENGKGMSHIANKLISVQQDIKSGISKQIESRMYIGSASKDTMAAMFPVNNDSTSSSLYSRKQISEKYEINEISLSMPSHTRSKSIDSIPSSIHQHNSSHSSSNSSIENRNRRSSPTTTHNKPHLIQTYAPGNWAPKTDVDAVTFEHEQEAMNLAWQAHAESMALSAARGEYQSMQSFLRTPKKTSNKVWAVLREGVLSLYSHSSDNLGVVEKGNSIASYKLNGCVCRPLEQAKGFEITFSDPKSVSVSFWTETDIQCRGWVMAVQHSSILPKPKSPSISTAPATLRRSMSNS